MSQGPLRLQILRGSFGRVALELAPLLVQQPVVKHHRIPWQTAGPGSQDDCDRLWAGKELRSQAFAAAVPGIAIRRRGEAVQEPLVNLLRVGIEIQLADGRRDIFISKNVEGQSTTNSALVVGKGNGVRFEGDLCLVRFDATQRPTQVLFCRGKSLRIGKPLVQARNEQASFEIDLANRNAPVVSGPANEVDLIELTGAKLWPK